MGIVLEFIKELSFDSFVYANFTTYLKLRYSDILLQTQGMIDN